MSNKTVIEFYISTGSKGIFHTLRKTTNIVGDLRQSDSFVKNLSINEDEAIKSASEYVEQFSNVIGGNDNYHILFDELPRHSTTNSWGDGKLASYKLSQLQDINHGIMPFGIHKGKLFNEVPSDYLGWCCEQGAKKENDKVAENLASASLAVLIERKVILSFSELEAYTLGNKEKRKEKDLLSDYVGMQGERKELTAIIEHSKSSWDDRYNQMKHFYKLKIGDNILTYSGTVELGNKDDVIKVKATIDKHTLYKGVKSTILKRPILL